MISLEDIRADYCEYTTGCGWIDWSHATPNRPDAVMTWTRFPHPVRSGQEPLDLRELRDIPQDVLRRLGVPQTEGYLVAHTPVVTPTVQPVCWESYRTFHYLVPRGQSEAEYRRMYFYMYQHGCQFAEDWQQPHRGVTAEHSVHSFEDYVSNLMSFYANVMGWCTGRYTVTAQHDQREQTARQAIRSRAGGFADQAVRRQVSETVFAGIRDVQAGLRSSSWTRAYLRNDLVPAAHRPNTLQGWQDLPEAFRAFTPRQCYRFRHPRAEADQWALRRLGDFAEGVRRTAGRVGDAARDAVDWVRGRADDLSPGTRGGGGADTGVGDAGHRPGVEGQ